MKKKYKALSIFLLILLFIIMWSWALTFYSPEEIVAYIGINEGYFLVFLISIIGGVSTVTAISFYTTIMTLIVGGLNLFIVGVLVGIGATIGDSIFFYMGLKLKECIFKKNNKNK
ncbi:MAG: hypothetical protein QM490_01525, partial [Candidatus Gracilibacteria bacterium]